MANAAFGGLFNFILSEHVGIMKFIHALAVESVIYYPWGSLAIVVVATMMIQAVTRRLHFLANLVAIVAHAATALFVIHRPEVATEGVKMAEAALKNFIEVKPASGWSSWRPWARS